MDKKTETQKPEVTVPFFARKDAERELTVRTGVRAGLAEQDRKRG